MHSASSRSRILYLAFLIPFVVAYLSWQFFPMLAQQVLSVLFRYPVQRLEANLVWYVTIQFFYTWYTFLAIGIAGFWVLSAVFARRNGHKSKKLEHPCVSFIIPAYNEEKNVARCLTSVFRCAEEYNGCCEVIVVDDGSSDHTYEKTWSTLECCRRKCPRVRVRVVRHSTNLGKVEAIKTGLNKALGDYIAVVDADSWWTPDTLNKLIDGMLVNGRKAVTGYVHPSDGDMELDPFVVLQQLEYSQGLGVNRCAQSLGDKVVVISGAVGVYDANVFREILRDKDLHSVTEDLEITLEMHKRGAKVGYVNNANALTVTPSSFKDLWEQRLRWFAGWLHNTSAIHRDMLKKRSWLTLLLWYSYIFEYVGAFVDLGALIAFPILFWFAPDRIFFVLNMLVFFPYTVLISVFNQSLALKLAYNEHNYRQLLFYTPFYPILRLINIIARLSSSISYFLGNHGRWHTATK